MALLPELWPAAAHELSGLRNGRHDLSARIHGRAGSRGGARAARRPTAVSARVPDLRRGFRARVSGAVRMVRPPIRRRPRCDASRVTRAQRIQRSGVGGLGGHRDHRRRDDRLFRRAGGEARERPVGRALSCVCHCWRRSQLALASSGTSSLTSCRCWPRAAPRLAFAGFPR